VVVWLIAQSDTTVAPAAGWWFGSIAITDLLDGFLARRLQAQSKLGRVLDPLADRLLMAAGLIGLLMLGRLPWPAPTVILVRDAFAVGAFVWLAKRGVAGRRCDLLARSCNLRRNIRQLCAFGGTWVASLRLDMRFRPRSGMLRRDGFGRTPRKRRKFSAPDGS
jgi:phosphatidylglycerophosphate synthase